MKYFILLCCFIAVSGCKQPEEIRIGYVGPLSGRDSEKGQAIYQGILLAVEEWKQKNELPLILAVEDSHSIPEGTLEGAKRLLEQENMHAIISGTSGTETHELPDLAEKHQVVVLSAANYIPTKNSGNTGQFNDNNVNNKYFYHLLLGKKEQAEAMAQYVFEKLNIRQLGVLSVKGGYIEQSGYLFAEAFQSLGGFILSIETVLPETTDFHVPLSKLHRVGASHLYIALPLQEAVIAMQEAERLGLNFNYYGSGFLYNPAIFELGNDMVSGTLITSPFRPLYSPEYTVPSQIQDLFYKRWGKGPAHYHLVGYDAANIILDAVRNTYNELEETGKDRILDIAKSMHTFHGTSGIISFDETGKCSVRPTILQLKDDKFVIID